MPDAVRAIRRSPLAARNAIGAPDGSVRLAEIPFLGKWILRVDPGASAETVRTALGYRLPVEALTSSGDGVSHLLWFGPDEWMLAAADDLAETAAIAVGAALAGTYHQIVDVGDYYTAIDIAGPHARELLMKLTALDLHPRAFRHGMVAGSVFGRANATLWQMDDDAASGRPCFRLFVRWSMADYLWCLLAECGREWGIPEQIPVKGERLTIL